MFYGFYGASYEVLHSPRKSYEVLRNHTTLLIRRAWPWNATRSMQAFQVRFLAALGISMSSMEFISFRENPRDSLRNLEHASEPPRTS